MRVVEYPDYINKIINKLEHAIPGVYRIIVCTESDNKITNTSKEFCIPIYKMEQLDKNKTTVFRYIHLTQTLETSEVRTKLTINQVKSRLKRIFSGKAFHVNSDEVKSVNVIKVANTMEGYFKMLKTENDEFDMVNIISSLCDGIYEIYPHQKVTNQQKSIYMIKHNGECYLYGHTPQRDCFEEVNPKQINAIVSLMFGGAYGIKLV